MRALDAVLAAATLLAAACSDQPAEPASGAGGSLLWRIEGPSGAGWLLGTMHVSDPRAIVLTEAAQRAFDAAGALYTEIDGGIAAGARVQQVGTLPPTEALSDLLPPELDRRLVGYLQSLGLRMNEFERFRPWMATLALGQIQAIEFLRHGPPLDEVLRTRAREAGKRVGAVETVEEQIAALSSASLEHQVRLLDVALTRLEEDARAGRNRLRETFEAWLRGDEAALVRQRDEELDLSDPAQAEWWDALFTRRNRRMAERADLALRQAAGAEPMFALGALHFVGEDSVVELLRDLGWTVTRVR